MQKCLALVEMLSPVLLGHKKKGRMLGQWSLITLFYYFEYKFDKNTTSNKSLEVLPPISSEKE